MPGINCTWYKKLPWNVVRRVPCARGTRFKASQGLTSPQGPPRRRAFVLIHASDGEQNLQTSPHMTVQAYEMRSSGPWPDTSSSMRPKTLLERRPSLIAAVEENVARASNTVHPRAWRNDKVSWRRWRVRGRMAGGAGREGGDRGAP